VCDAVNHTTFRACIYFQFCYIKIINSKEKGKKMNIKELNEQLSEHDLKAVAVPAGLDLEGAHLEGLLDEILTAQLVGPVRLWIAIVGDSYYVPTKITGESLEELYANAAKAEWQ
jgi:hypothetical protein